LNKKTYEIGLSCNTTAVTFVFFFMPTTYLFFLLNVGVKRRCCRRVEVFLFIQENRIFIFLMVNVTFTNNFSDLKKAGDDDAF
jgi:hypothetical protein